MTYLEMVLIGCVFMDCLSVRADYPLEQDNGGVALYDLDCDMDYMRL